jgi:hypothetical protein
VAALARRWPAAHGAMGWRRRVLAATQALPPLAEAQALAAELHERGLAPLARHAHRIAARSALAEGAREPALAHVRRALAGGSAVDPWTDEPAALWLETAAVLREAGAPEQAREVLAQGRAWLAQAALALPEPARAAWLHGHPLHRALSAPG